METKKDSGFLEPNISVCRQSKMIACCDGLEIVQSFKKYEDESIAIQEAHEWFKNKTIHVPQVVFPMIKKIRANWTS